MNQRFQQEIPLTTPLAATHTSMSDLEPVVVKSYVGVLDLYAETIIAGRIHEYNGIEIQGVRDSSPGDETSCEVDNTHPQFFSIYLHLVDGGSECAGDCEHYSQAREYAKRLHIKYGWPIVDYFKMRVESYIHSRTGQLNAGNSLVEPFITLSNGRTVIRRQLPNGAKEAFMLDGAFASESEHDEYWRRMKHIKSMMN